MTTTPAPSAAAQRRMLHRDGFLIHRGLIPPDQLEPLRAAAESMVERTKAQAAAQRKPSEPPNGWWDIVDQPRVLFGPGWQDPPGLPIVEFAMGPQTLGFTRDLLGSPEAAPLYFAIMCNPEDRDRGPAAWHRDIHPIDMAPLDGLQLDIKNNGAYYLQWNIPLYDDNVLWVIPGSHLRRNTPEETRLGKENPRQPFPGAVHVDLKAGDAVVYINLILHWGSNYSTVRRRTVHGGYRQFGGKLGLNHPPTAPPREGDYSRLSPQSRQLAQRAEELWAAELNADEAIYRAILAKDVLKFHEGLARLHPGRVGRLVYVVVLSKIVIDMLRLKRAGKDTPWPGAGHIEDLAHRFTLAELETLMQRFARLDAALQTKEDQFEPLFQSGPMKYNFYAMPKNFGINEFIAGW